MKKQILKISAIFLMAFGANAQILDADAFGFELTNVEWTTGGPGNIVEAWTQRPGFEQSSAQANSGTYSLKADIDYTDVDPLSPRLQSWRSNINEEGNFSLTERDYLLSAWVYLESGTAPQNLSLSFSGGFQAISLSDVPVGVWTRVYAIETAVADPDLGGNNNSMSINFGGTTPTTGSCVIYVDDILIEEYDGVQSFALEGYLGFESADAVIEGVIEPASNGNSIATGWFLQNTSHFNFSDEQAKTGDYSMKFDSTGGTGGNQIQGGGATSPANSQLSLAADSYVFQADIFIPVGKTIPSSIQLSVSDPFKARNINVDPSLSKGVWHTITSTATSFLETTDSRYVLKITASDTNTVVYVDNLRWVLESTLSTSRSKIEGVSVNAENGSITVSGANLDAVYSITGQQVGTDGLASGVYIVKISKNGKQDDVKVVL